MLPFPDHIKNVESKQNSIGSRKEEAKVKNGKRVNTNWWRKLFNLSEEGHRKETKFIIRNETLEHDCDVCKAHIFCVGKKIRSKYF